MPTPTQGQTKWMIPSLFGEDYVEKIEGILVYQTARGVLWVSDEPVEGTLPVLISDDLKTARRVCAVENVPDEMIPVLEDCHIQGDLFDWTALPYNEWGSGRNGVGKRAKEQRVLFILRKSDPLPLVVVIQPGSLKYWRKFIVELTKAGIPFYRAVISLGLEKAASEDGITYSRIKPSLVGCLSPEDGLSVKKQFSDSLARIARRVSVEE